MRRVERTDGVSGGFALRRTARFGTRPPAGIGGWLLIYVIARMGLLLHQLQLTVGAIVVYLDPEVVGIRSFVPLSSLLLYEATNWLLVGLTVAALVSIRRRSRMAIAANVALSGLWLAALVVWQFLGLKSPVGTMIDATPALFGLWYFLTSTRVRNTFARIPV